MGVSMDTVWMKLYRKELKVKSSNKERKNVIKGTTKNQYTKILENIAGLQVTSYKKKKTKQHINIESKTRAKVNLILLTSNIIFLTTKNNTKKKKISNFFKKKKKKKKKKK